ncbi:hypothetical protein V2J09_022843, partial [Rumex salicifolius]
AATDSSDLEKELAAALGFCSGDAAVPTTTEDEVATQDDVWATVDEVAAWLDGGGDGGRRVRRRTDTYVADREQKTVTCTQDVCTEDVRSSPAMSCDNFEIDYDDAPGPSDDAPGPSYDGLGSSNEALGPSDHTTSTSDHALGPSDQASAETIDAPPPSENASAPAETDDAPTPPRRPLLMWRRFLHHRKAMI